MDYLPPFHSLTLYTISSWTIFGPPVYHSLLTIVPITLLLTTSPSIDPLVSHKFRSLVLFFFLPFLASIVFNLALFFRYLAISVLVFSFLCVN